MSIVEFKALQPLLGVAGASVVVMLALVVYRNHRMTASLTLLGLAGSFGLIFNAAASDAVRVTPLLLIDGYALFYFGLLLACSFVVAALSYGYLKGRKQHSDEFYLLLLFATLGTLVLVASTHFVSLFLGLELLSISLYAMIAYFRTKEKSVEAGIKYLILAAVSSAFLLFGMALLYARLGELAFGPMAEVLAAGEAGIDAVVLAGLALMMVGVGFKLAVVPFHMWTPDVYEGAPVPVTAYVATASKGAMVALLVRYAVQIKAEQIESILVLFALLAAASMILGNLLALLQNNVKRLLAYSSIAHLGYVLVAFLAGGGRGGEAVAYYLAAYFVTSLGAFGVITAISGKERDLDEMEDYQGLGRRRPFVAAIFTAMLLSLAGIPLTAGFVGKFLVLRAGVGATLWALVIILILGSAVSIYYYLRVVVAMYMRSEEEEGTWNPLSLLGGVTLAVLTLALLWLGVWPAPFMNVIRSTVVSLF